MILYSRVTDIPDSEPVTVSEAKTHLEVTGTSKDTYISSLITTARRMCEAYSGLSFVSQERKIMLDYFPSRSSVNPMSEIIVPYGPVVSIDSFTYLKTDLTTGTLVANTDYLLDNHSELARLFPLEDGELDSWPDTANRPNAVTIEYTAGYDDISYNPLPEQVRQAILLQVGAMFENRQDEVVGVASSTVLSFDSKALLDTIKVDWNANY